VFKNHIVLGGGVSEHGAKAPRMKPDFQVFKFHAVSRSLGLKQRNFGLKSDLNCKGCIFRYPTVERGREV